MSRETSKLTEKLGGTALALCMALGGWMLNTSSQVQVNKSKMEHMEKLVLAQAERTEKALTATAKATQDVASALYELKIEIAKGK